ncbi:MAG: IS21 family transposase [bacterium]|nr:IS21 family transposase [bacterium]
MRKLMEEMGKHGKIGRAAMHADMDRKTARKYVKAGKLPSDCSKAREYRTRDNPFTEDWAWVEGQLATSPGLEAKTLFECLQERHPGRYSDGQLRTLQRHIRDWRAQQGPEKEIFFGQEHRPGEAAQTDFTHTEELKVTIQGMLYLHLLCNFVLPYSNWQWVTVCLSESYLALKRGVQAAAFRLGRLPTWHQTDNSTSATHRPSKGKRRFNADYEALMRHYGMKPRTTGIGEKEQNGDVEASNGALKRRLEQALLVRGSRDFESVEEYEQWVQSVVSKANLSRHTRLEEELPVMEPVTVSKLADYKKLDVPVQSGATIRVLRNTYSVPSRLIGHTVEVRASERIIEVWYGNKLQMVAERLLGRGNFTIDYRHVIWSLVKKPGAFARYRYQPALFPTLAFRAAYDGIVARQPDTRGDLEYLRILHLAAATMQGDVEAALECLVDAGLEITFDAVHDLVVPSQQATVPEMEPFEVELALYDEHRERAS